MKKEYIIFNQRLAGFLMLSGFVLKRMEKSKYDDYSNKNVFIFNDTDKLHTAIEEYKSFQ